MLGIYKGSPIDKTCQNKNYWSHPWKSCKRDLCVQLSCLQLLVKVRNIIIKKKLWSLVFLITLMSLPRKSTFVTWNMDNLRWHLAHFLHLYCISLHFLNIFSFSTFRIFSLFFFIQGRILWCLVIRTSQTVNTFSCPLTLFQE